MNTAFVFVHGAWHNQSTWTELRARLEPAGHKTYALDLPGAGVNARMPAALTESPFDAAAFATEPSPNAGVTQAERTDAVKALVERAAAEGSKVVLVGHSLGGITISPVAEAVPQHLHAVVYLSAFMLVPDMPPVAMILHETMKKARVPELFMADPAQVGALRINTRSADPAYRAIFKDAFYGDVSDDMLGAFIDGLHCDEPAAVVMQPSPLARASYGRVPRHYIRCHADQAIVPKGQDFMIAAMDAAMGNATQVHDLSASHSPFLSRPDELGAMLTRIAT
jgi:pimeloyl-ACP methyl ester carboxylesterase